MLGNNRQPPHPLVHRSTCRTPVTESVCSTAGTNARQLVGQRVVVCCAKSCAAICVRVPNRTGRPRARRAPQHRRLRSVVLCCSGVARTSERGKVDDCLRLVLGLRVGQSCRRRQCEQRTWQRTIRQRQPARGVRVADLHRQALRTHWRASRQARRHLVRLDDGVGLVGARANGVLGQRQHKDCACDGRSPAIAAPH